MEAVKHRDGAVVRVEADGRRLADGMADRMGARRGLGVRGSASGRGLVGAGEGEAFTLIELLVVISIIGVLAALLVGLAGMASRKSKEARVRAEMNELITAIEGYKAKLGFYPPDNRNAAGFNISPVTNQLFYELTGVVATNAGFITPSHDEYVTSADVKRFFNTEGFVNSARSVRDLKYRHPFKTGRYTEVSEEPDIDLLVVPVPWLAGDPNPPVPGRKGLNPWRYVSSNPTNNPGRFDLWAEFLAGGKKLIICNWSKDTIVVDR